MEDRAHHQPRRDSPRPETMPVEMELSLHVTTGNPAEKLAACRVLERWRDRHLSLADAARHATPALVITVVTSEDPSLRRAALDALSALRPDLSEGARRFLATLETNLELVRHESYPPTRETPRPAMPYVEQQVIIGRLLTEGVYLHHAHPSRSDHNSSGQFALVALENALGGKVVTETADELASIRPTLPREMIESQEAIDSLHVLNLIPFRVFLSSRVGALPRDHDYTSTRTNQLMRLLAQENNYDSAMMLVMELGRVGDRRAIQAIRQAMLGLVTDQGMILDFRSDEQRRFFRRTGERAIALIEERLPE